MSGLDTAMDSDVASQRRLAAGTLRRQARRMQAEIAGVIAATDSECVHRMRVASRRLRSCLRIFDPWLPKVARRKWLRPIKRVTRSLAYARDLDVQIEALSVWRAALANPNSQRAVAIRWLIDRCQTQRIAVQPALNKAMQRLRESKVLPRIARWSKRKAGSIPAQSIPDMLAAHADTLYEQVETVLAGSTAARDFESVQEHHATRLAVKQVRYTLEALAPLAPEAFEPLVAGVRRLQVTLGNLHDCDVWIERLPADREAAASVGASEQVLAGMQQMLDDRRQERVALFNTFLRAWDAELSAGTWDRIARIESTAGDWAAPLGAEAMETTVAADWDPGLQALRDRCDPDQGHTDRVAINADQLFVALADLHNLEAEARGWLREAAWLHDIGWCEGGQGHHKTSLRLILSADELDWKDRHRQIVGSVARYHRKALPSAGHTHFATLSNKDRDVVQKLAALLRMADGLDYAHEQWLLGVGAVWTRAAIDINCRATKPPTVEVDRASVKADLARLVFDRDVTVTWHLQETPSQIRS